MHMYGRRKHYLTLFFYFTYIVVCMLCIGQLHLWNPDEPGTPRGSVAPLSDLEERLYSACQQLSLPLHGTATLQQLRTLCQHLDLEVHTHKHKNKYICLYAHGTVFVYMF